MTCRRYCAVFGCMNSSLSHPEISFFALPEDLQRRIQWLQLIRRDDLGNKSKFTSYRVCEKHFNLEDVLRSSNRKLLKKNALPLLMLPSVASTDPGVSRKEDQQTQTDPLAGNENCTQTENATVYTVPTPSRAALCENRRAIWLNLISREELQDRQAHSYVVCEEHFDPGTIQGTPERKRLRRFSVPSLNLPAKRSVAKQTQTEIRENLNKFAQTDFYVLKIEKGAQTANFLTTSLPSVKKLKEELITSKKQLKSVASSSLNKNTFHKLCDKFLTKPLADIVKAQTKLKFHGKGNRYSPKYKQFCINLYYTSPQAYKLLEQALCLPNAATLARHSLPISTEVNEHLMTTLKAKVSNMTNSEKVCSVIVDAINLKTSLFYNIKLDKIIGLQEVNGRQSSVLAKKALVVIIRGIFGNWQQPIGFALLGESKNSDDVSNWIEQLLEKLIDVGLDIRTFVSDLSSDLLSQEKRNLVSTERPYFFIKNRKIFYIIDALHLIKSLRNNLMTNDFYFQGSVAKYEHILQFYESEKNKTLRLAPKLTESHIKPNIFEKVQVKFATELLSHTVATAISCYIDFQAIQQSAKETVRLIKLINDLFDILNSSTMHSTCELQQAFCGSVTQITFMNEMLQFFKSLRLINSTTGRDVTSTAKFVTGYQITITSILCLFDDLRVEGYNNLLTGRLNQDVTDIFFGQVRSKRKKPTTRQFVSAFRKVFFSNIIKPGKQGKGSNDLSQLLVNTENLGFILSTEAEENVRMEEDFVETNTEPSTPSISSSDYCKIELPEDNRLSYVSSYLYNKCANLHGDCQMLKTCLRHNDNLEIGNMDVDGLPNNEPDELRFIPAEGFVDFVQDMERNYQSFFNNYYINCKIAKSIYESMSSIIYSPPCLCFPINYAKKLFIRIRIYITVKYNNEEFSKHRSAKKCFSVVNL